MRRNKSEPLLFDPEPDHTIRRRRAHQRLVTAMAGNGGGGPIPNPEEEARIEAAVQERLAQRLQEQQLRDASQSLRDQTAASMSYNYPGSIVCPNAGGQHFELRPSFISLVSQDQFGGSSKEDPHAHLERFVRNCNTYHVHNVTPDMIRLASFPFSLRDAAEEWLNSQPQGSITTWDDLAKKFITKFVPRAVLRKKKEEIASFAQSEAENLHEAWERFKRLLRKCPQHGFSEAEQINKFYDGLLYSVKSTLDAAARGEFDALSPQAGKELIEKMAARDVNTVSDRQSVRKVFEVDAMDQIIASNRQLAKQVHELQKQVLERTLMQVSSRGCVTCGGLNCGEQCLETMAAEEAKYMGQQAPYSKPYNNNQGFQGQGARPQEQNSSKRSMEEMIEIFMARQDENIKKQEDANNRRDAAMREQHAVIKNLENQMGQMAKQLSERNPGTLPSDTHIPSIENASAITTRSGKVLPVVEVLVEVIAEAFSILG